MLDAVTGNTISVIESQSYSRDVRAIAFSLDGSILASVGGDGVSLWNLSDQALLQKSLPFEGVVNSVEFSLDGSLMAYGDTNGTTYLWGLEEDIVEVVDESGIWVSDVSFSADGSRLAVATNEGSILVWNVAEKLVEFEMRFGHGLAVNDVSFSMDSTLLASGGEDGVIRLWDIAIKQLVSEFGNSRILDPDLAFDPTGKFLVSDHDGVTVWDTESGVDLVSVDVDDEWPINSTAYSPLGDSIALATLGYGAIYLWDNLSDTAAPLILGYHDSPVSVLAFSPEGNLLVSGGLSMLKIWDVETQQLIQTFTSDVGDITDVDFTSDGSLLAFSSGNTLKIVNMEDQIELVAVEANFGGIRGVDFSTDDTLIATVGNDGTIQLWGIP